MLVHEAQSNHLVAMIGEAAAKAGRPLVADDGLLVELPAGSDAVRVRQLE